VFGNGWLMGQVFLRGSSRVARRRLAGAIIRPRGSSSDDLTNSQPMITVQIYIYLFLCRFPFARRGCRFFRHDSYHATCPLLCFIFGSVRSPSAALSFGGRKPRRWHVAANCEQWTASP